ncbi:MAG: DNA repair protein RecO C-terminal domain-containing protein, partial [Deltaproteobacteria bacterium]|nr:DNA repair protein RecO C-terminal domain-containing protein [Deltaproteobacteria bacterium]
VNLDRCCICGRSYTGAGRAVFKRTRGGIACLNCEHESGVCPGMGSDAIKGLRQIQSAPLNEINGVQLTEEAIREIKPVLKLHIEYRVGQRLKSAKYLE